jgi:ammonium transporter Rh
MRVIVNTALALSASCISAFGMSSIYHHEKFDMEDVLNATLAGGVIVGSTSDMMESAWAVILLGMIGGVISSTGFNKLKFSFHDTCGVNNLHGMPGIIGGLSGCVLALTLNDEGIESIFGARVEGGRTAA